MPCEKCGKILYIDSENSVCLKCSGLGFLPQYEAEMVSEYKIGLLNSILSKYISQKNKYKLIAHLMNLREKLASDFFMEIPRIEPHKFLAINILIQRIMRDGNIKGSLDLETTIDEIVNIFNALLRVCEENISITEGLATYAYNTYIPFTQLRANDVFDPNYRIIYREEWKCIVKSYENELFMTKPAANEYLKKNQEEYERGKRGTSERIPYSPRTFIEKAFPAIKSLHAVFQKNQLFQKMFNFENLKKSGISLNDISTIFGKFERVTGSSKLMAATTEEELDVILDNMKLDKNHVKSELLMTDSNTEIFPFLTKVYDGKKERILITPKFFRLIQLVLHPIFYKDIFDSIKDTRGRSFETEVVQKEFEKHGYSYLPNIKDKKDNPKLEIDGVAFNNSKIYVCEVKFWGIKPFFDQLRVHSQIIRDIQGIVDGKKYTTKNGVLKITTKPKMIDKIDYVRRHKEELGIDKNIQDIHGVIVTSLVPIKKEYKDIRFISVDEIKEL